MQMSMGAQKDRSHGGSGTESVTPVKNRYSAIVNNYRVTIKSKNVALDLGL